MARKRRRADPLYAPDCPDYNWLEDHHQQYICAWLRDQKALRRLSFDIGMEGVRLPMGLRGKMKKQGMDQGVPDIKIKLCGGILIHIELKRWKGTVSPAQKVEHELLRDLGHIVYVVKERTPKQALDRVKEIIAKYET